MTTTGFTKQYNKGAQLKSFQDEKKNAFRNAEIFGIWNFVGFSEHITPFYLLITVLEITFNYNVYYDNPFTEQIQVNSIFSVAIEMHNHD